MVSAIDPTKPIDGVPAEKADLRDNLAAAKSEIEALQAGTGLANDAVTLAKIQNAAASSKLLGSGSAGAGANYVEITLDSTLIMTGTTIDVPATKAGVSTNAGTAITVNAASFGNLEFIKILCTAAGAVTITLANDVPAGKTVELVRRGAGNVTGQAGSGATLVKPASASHATTEQYEALVYEVDTNTGTNAAWRLVARP